MPGVYWHTNDSWTATWNEEKKQNFNHFHVHHFMNTGKNHSEAEADALRAAFEFRKGPGRSGIAKAKCERKPQSGVKGVIWILQKNYWQARLKFNGKWLHGGTFKPKWI